MKLIEVLNPRDAFFVESMTFSMYQSRLFSKDTLSLVLKKEGVCIGLGLVCLKSSCLLSIYVSASFRMQSYGSKLLLGILQECKKREMSSLKVSYHRSFFLDHFFGKLGFSKPIPKMLCLRYCPEKMGKTRWVRKVPLPKDYEIFPFQEKTEKDEKRFEEILSRKDFPKELRDVSLQAEFARKTSFGLRKKGRLLGWILTHEVLDYAIRYSNLYLEEKNPLLSIALMTTAIRAHCTKVLDKPVAVQGVYYSYREMIHLAERKLVPYAERVDVSVDREYIFIS